MNPVAKKVISGLAAAAAGYGIVVGTAHEARQPDNLSDAQQKATFGHFGLDLTRDVGIGLIDDLAGIAFLNSRYFKKRFSQYEGLAHAGIAALSVTGAAVGGTIAGHDYMNWQAAKSYVNKRNVALQQSQAQIPDSRLNPLSGFNNKGAAGQQRRDMTGIGSPAAGGIFYNMLNNPFAHMLNRTITAPDKREAQDPRAKALTYSWAGGVAGMLLGMRGGLAKATLGGLIGGTAAGLYGIHQAHNSDMRQNARALGDVALVAAPTSIMAGTLLGLASLRGRFAGVGEFATKTLSKTTHGIGAAGKWLAPRSDALYSNIQSSKQYVQRHAGGFAASHIDPLIVRATALTGHPKDLDVSGMVQGAAGVAGDAASLANELFRSQAIGMMIKTGKHDKTWEQALGVGHLIVAGPHQVALAATAAGIYQNHKSKATTTMPSSRRH